MKLYLVRHAQSLNNANPNDPPHDDAPLTELGHEQARITGAYLASLNLEPAALYASPMTRALQTVSYIQREIELRAQILPDICEAGGPRRPPGRTAAEILNDWPDVTLDERIGADGWWTDCEADDDEDAFYARADVAAELLLGRHANERRAVIAVTHGRFGSAIVSTLVGVGPTGYSNFPFDNCGITRIDFDPHQEFAYAAHPNPSPDFDGQVRAVRLRFHNLTAHLPYTHVT